MYRKFVAHENTLAHSSNAFTDPAIEDIPVKLSSFV
jgi:hypothetical protein